MPFTPFHFGAGVAAHAASPRRVSFLAFCAANVLTDVEPLWYSLRGEWPYHRFLHTFVGSQLTAAATVALYLAARALARRRPLPDPFGWQSLATAPVALGAWLGSTSHIVLDGLNHRDQRPFAPFSDANPMLGAMSRPAVETLCLALALLGLGVLAWRERRAQRAASPRSL